MTDQHPEPSEGELVPDAGPGGDEAGDGMQDLMGNLLGMAGQMQQQMMAAQEQAAAQELEGRAGGGAVVIKLTGAGEFLDVTIAPEAVDPSDVPMLEDLVLAALHDAMEQVQDLQQQSMGPLGGLDLGGLDLGGLFGGGQPGT